MAGSIKWFEYVTDLAVKFALSMDESNGEIIGNQDVDATIPQYGVPVNVKPRQIIYASDDKRITRRIPVSTQAAFVNDANTPPTMVYPLTNPETGAVVGHVTLRRIGRSPERIRTITSGDTGLNDGDFT